MAESQPTNPGGGDPLTGAVDAEIAAERKVGESIREDTRDRAASNDRLENLYRKKSSLVNKKPKAERDDGAVNFQPSPEDIAPDGQVMSEEQRQAKNELDQLGSQVKNEYGQDALENIGSALIGEHAPFKNVEGLDAFVKRSGLDAEGRTEALMAIGEVVSMALPEKELSVDATISEVNKSLRNLWGDRYSSNLAMIKEVGISIYGSVAELETHWAKQGWTRSAQHQLRACLALAKVGRRIAAGRAKG